MVALIPPLVAPLSTAAAAPTTVPQPVTVQSSDGQLVCNTSAAFSQIPGRPDMFVGRGWSIGSLEDCHKPAGHLLPFLALFKMDWQRHTLVMQHYLVKPPAKIPGGVELRAAYDPSVASYKGDLWVAFECAVPGAVSSCVAPLARDLSRLDLSRFSVAAIGLLGPHGPNRQTVCLLSASAPTLLSYGSKLYLYWQADYFDNQAPENHLTSRGMQLDEDGQGRLWGVGSGGKPVLTNDPRLTTLVHDVNFGDKTTDHVAATSDLVVIGDKIMEFASIGGTGGRETCRSTHDASPGCWRMSLSRADAPLGANLFGLHPLPADNLQPEVIEYPRIIVDPSGRHFLMGFFEPPVLAAVPGRMPPLTAHGLLYIPFEPNDFLTH